MAATLLSLLCALVSLEASQGEKWTEKESPKAAFFFSPIKKNLLVILEATHETLSFCS